jgi:glutathione peroxidase
MASKLPVAAPAVTHYGTRMSLYDYSLTDIDGNPRSLGDFRGKAVLLVNVASRCGLTPHYTGLQRLYTELKERGLEVLGIPCNQFGAQEPGTEAEIKEFCSTKYAVTFPLFSKLDVNGAGRDPLYAWLTSLVTQPDGAGDIKWNFAKFVVDRNGNVVARFGPQTDPSDPALRDAIEKALG